MDVRGPDGQIVRFPDGTDPQTVSRVMSSIHSGTGPDTQPQGSQGVDYGQVRPQDAQRILQQEQADLQHQIAGLPPAAQQIAYRKFAADPRITQLQARAQAVATHDPEGAVGTFADAASNTVMGGWRDKIAAGIDTILPSTPYTQSVWSGGGLANAFAHNRAYEQAQTQVNEQAHPVAATLGGLGGGFALPLPGGSLRARLGGAAAYGASYGAGQSQAPTWGGQAEDAAKGSAGSLLTAGAFEGASRAVPAVAGAGARLLGIGADSEGAGANLVASRLASDHVDPQAAADMMQAGANNGVPTVLADLGPNARALAGSVSRQAGDARDIAVGTTTDRQLGMGERVQDAIGRDLGPTTNDIYGESDRLMQQARTKAAPLYEQAFSQAAPVSDTLDELAQRPSMQAALKRAYSIAKEEGRDPAELGFSFDHDGNVTLNDMAARDAGRYEGSVTPHENTVLTRTTVRGNNGNPVTKVGPTDLVGWLRQNGGLQDQNGELSHMGLTNAGRKMDFVGQETRFGPLINQQGMNFDDAAQAAGEAGYFPHLPDRPDVNTFLNAVRGTHEGWDRHFLPQDLPEIERFNGMRDQRLANQEYPVVTDKSVPANGPAPTGPDVAPTSYKMPTYQTWDYVKRGLDDVIEQNRDPLTGKLKLDEAGRAMNATKARLLNELDTHNPTYAAARSAYAGPASLNGAMWEGKAAINKSAQQINQRLSNMSQAEKDQYGLGLRYALSEAVSKKGDYADSARALIGTPYKRAMLQRAFGENSNVSRFLDTMGQEQAANATFNEVNRGSQTAARGMEDAQNSDAQLISHVGNAAKAISGGKAGIIRAGITGAQNAFTFGVGRAGQRTREQAASLLFSSNPNDFTGALVKAQARQALQHSRVNAFAGKASKAGAVIGAKAANVLAIQHNATP